MKKQLEKENLQEIIGGIAPITSGIFGAFLAYSFFAAIKNGKSDFAVDIFKFAENTKQIDKTGAAFTAFKEIISQVSGMKIDKIEDVVN